MMKKIIWGLMLLVVLLIVGCSGSNEVTGNTIDLSEDIVKIPVDEITDKLTKFEYDNVKYFVVLGSDGEVRTAFDACDVCGGAKGYHQQGELVVCNNCGQTFKIDDLGVKNTKGGCWPSKLSHQIMDGQVVIKTAELKSNAFRFGG